MDPLKQNASGQGITEKNRNICVTHISSLTDVAQITFATTET